MQYNDFDIRMKENYEKRFQTSLMRRTPVIIRVDGKAFHTFCKRFKKPYDDCLNCFLSSTMKYLCRNIQGAKFAERHSDEISILVTDYDTIQTTAYFNYNVQKICSVVASMATGEFCRQLLAPCEAGMRQDHYLTLDETFPVFDARCFNIPIDEVTNYFWWRMLDAKRNSICSLAQSHFSHNQLQGKSCDDMQEMLFQEKGINWGTLPQRQKIGNICKRIVKIDCESFDGAPQISKPKWTIDVSPSSREELSEIVEPLLLPNDATKEKETTHLSEIDQMLEDLL